MLSVYGDLLLAIAVWLSRSCVCGIGDDGCHVSAWTQFLGCLLFVVCCVASSMCFFNGFASHLTTWCNTETKFTGQSYVKTCHWDMGTLYKVCSNMVDNHHVISYLPYLLCCYQVHINIECTAGFQAVKYIYKACSLTLVPLKFTLCSSTTVCLQGGKNMAPLIQGGYAQAGPHGKRGRGM